jgi:aminoglycoside phosphotransferase family enzyme/predicted kinase
MELALLIEALSSPGAYTHPVDEVLVCQTHISAVFLAGPFAYKIKKAVNPGFLDFSTLEKRRHFCEEEVRLNRRLAPTVYLGVVPVTQDGPFVCVEGQGTIVEWAVKMERLPAEATLRRRLRTGAVGVETIGALARKIAAFHRGAVTNERIATFGRFDAVARNIRENFEGAPVGVTLSRAVLDLLQTLREKALARMRPVIEARAERGVPREVHGDLRLDHVYHFPERTPPADLVIIDCIEFNERFRFIDPVADTAFLIMDMVRAGRRDLAQHFADTYFEATGDAEGRTLLPLYVGYRATVRGKVEGMKSQQAEVPEGERAAALVEARAHWLLALGELEEPARRPGLVLIAGLPGAGKSTLARSLAEQSGFALIRSDEVRKELAAGSKDIYSPEWSERTYAECLRRAEGLLFEGRRVLVDANFRKEQQRRTFLEAAARGGVRTVLLVCRASPEVVRERLAARGRDVSDADWRVYRKLAAEWEEPGDFSRRFLREIGTNGSREEGLNQVREVLREVGL